MSRPGKRPIGAASTPEQLATSSTASEIEAKFDSLEAAGYTQLSEIARGGSSRVYRAWEGSFKRWVAIKIMEIGSPTASRSQFRRECAAIGSLGGHPHIVTVHAAWASADRNAYIVMEYLSDGSVAEELLKGPMDWQRAASIGVQLSGALESAHRVGVLHLDVKPENVFLRRDFDIVKLGDFGIASIAGTTETFRGMISGTLLHISPERLRDAPPTVASDIYSLGSTLFTLLSGTPPFGRPDEPPAVVMARLLGDRPAVPDLAAKGVPASMCRVIEQALAEDPAQRQTTAAEIGNQLRLVQAGEGLAPTAMMVAGPNPTVLPASDQHVPSTGEQTLPPALTPVTATKPSPMGLAGEEAPVASSGTGQPRHRPRIRTTRAKGLLSPWLRDRRTSDRDGIDTIALGGTAGVRATVPEGSPGAADASALPASDATATTGTHDAASDDAANMNWDSVSSTNSRTEVMGVPGDDAAHAHHDVADSETTPVWSDEEAPVAFPTDSRVSDMAPDVALVGDPDASADGGPEPKRLAVTGARRSANKQGLVGVLILLVLVGSVGIWLRHDWAKPTDGPRSSAAAPSELAKPLSEAEQSEALRSLIVAPSDVPPSLKVSRSSGGTGLSEPTLDLCFAKFPSEGLRTSRVQNVVVNEQGRPTFSSEAVLYSEPGVGGQAVVEIKSAAAACPATPVISAYSGRAWITQFNSPPDTDWPQIATVTRTAFDVTRTDTSGRKDHSIAVYLQRGRALLAVYFFPDSAPPAIAGQTTMAGIVGVFAERLAALSPAVVGA